MSAMHNMHASNTLATSLLVICLFSTNTAVFANEAAASQALTSAISHAPETKQLFKVDQNGERLSEESQLWECVEDSDTALFWQKRDPTTALHGHDSYNWYQPKHENSGQPRSNPDLFGIDASCYGYRADDPSSYCNTDAFIKRVNQSNYCGFSDWRLPSSDELLSLVDPTLAGRPYQSAIDLRYFPFKEAFAYWTDTVNADGVVTTVIQDEKLLTNSERNDHLLVRLVRGLFKGE